MIITRTNCFVYTRTEINALIKITFLHYVHAQISHDDCFNGGYLPSVYTIKAGEWRWYTLEREMSEGTQCNFTTTVRNTLLGIRKTLGTSTCSVKSKYTLVLSFS